MNKATRLFIFLLFVPVSFYAQTLTGLWTGSLTNDSNTIRKNQELEIVLTQYKDKVYGYSRMTFMVHDTLYYIVKRVKGTIVDDLCEVKDDEIVTHNFPRKPDKGVKLVSTFRRNRDDSSWTLDGDWKTTESKKQRYYSISGKLSLKAETQLDKAKIFPHLEELNMTGDIAFYQEYRQVEESAVAARLAESTAKNRELAFRNNNPAPIIRTTPGTEPAPLNVPAQPVIKPVAIATEEKPEAKEKQLAAANDKDPVRGSPGLKNNEATANQTIAVSQRPVQVMPTKPATSTTTSVTNKEVAKKQATNAAATEPKQQAPTTSNTTTNIAGKESAAQKNAVLTPPATPPIKTTTIEQPAGVAAPVFTEVQKPETRRPEATAAVKAPDRITERAIAAPQIVYFRSDSLELSLYDNGEVDGDTVSVLLNGQLILEKQGLKTSAIKKTIYVPAGQSDSLTLVLFAENLGKYPPNTGLLVVHDGEDVYQVRFSADLRQNAAVVFKRRKN